MLPQQRLRLRPREVPQPQRGGLDVERAAPGDHRLLRCRPDAVVPHVAHPAEHDALGKRDRPQVVARAQLAEHRHQGVAHQRVDLVEEENQRAGIGLRPANEDLPQGGVGPGTRQDVGPYRVHEVVAQRQAGARRQLVEDRPHRPGRVLAPGLAGLDVRVHAPVVPDLAGVQQILERQQDGGLPGLPRRVEDEVALVPNEPEYVV